MDCGLLPRAGVNGALVGLMYSLVAIGIVLIYKSSSVPNLAQGAMAMLGAYVGARVRAACAARRCGSRSRSAMLTMFGSASRIERVALRRLAGRPIIMILMMTLGLDIFLRATALTIWRRHRAADAASASATTPLFLGPMLLNRAYAVGAAVALRPVRPVRAVLPHAGAASCCARSPTTTRRRGRSASRSSAASRCRGRCRRWSATVAGVLWGSVQGVDQSLSLLLLKGVTVAVLGGLDSIGGAMLAGIGSASLEACRAGVLDPLLGGGSRELVIAVDADPDHHGAAARPVRPPRHRADLAMLLRQAGIRHTDYAADRALFPIPADRAMVVALLALGARRAVRSARSTLSSYLLPWLVWTAATLGLNLILGWAGQFHFGYAAIMGIGAYAAVHAARHGVPWEIAVVLGGLDRDGDRHRVRVRRAARQGPVPRAQHAGAAVRDGLGDLARAGHQRRRPGDACRRRRCACSARRCARKPASTTSRSAGASLVTLFMLNLRRTALGRALVAVREKDFAAAVIGVAQLPLQAGRLRDLVVHRRRQRRDPDLHLLSRGHARAVRGQRLDRAARDGDRRRARQHHRQLLRRRLHPADAGADQQPDRLARRRWPARDLGVEALAHIPHAVYGALIIVFLLIEPMGLGKMYANVRNYLLVWPFGYARK